ncbi:hypothetical protein GOBAR_AA26813 [Gossypium barbadense]|uniref:Uncharacterized protein n=1 Tax=Gossypium barbadense TaxID=3634 RepID=A0A2P5WRY8_GOSBA|nr:hypothetical protein GOBAR_AA26813 [Gossypium barbadense]
MVQDPTKASEESMELPTGLITRARLSCSRKLKKMLLLISMGKLFLLRGMLPGSRTPFLANPKLPSVLLDQASFPLITASTYCYIFLAFITSA